MTTDKKASQSPQKTDNGNKEKLLLPLPRWKLWYAMIIIYLLYFLDFATRSVISPMFPILKKEMNLSDAQLGWLSTIVLAMVCLLAIPLSYFIDRWSRRKMMALMSIVWSAGSFFSGLSTNFAQLLATRGVLGVGEASFTSAGQAMIMATIKKARRATVTGIWTTAAPLGMAFGMLIGGLVGSPRKEANTYRLVKTALEEAATVPGAEVEIYEMASKKINHCIGCHKCGKIFRCVFKDDLMEYMEKYLEADGIIWGAPVYHMGLPSLMKAAMDRLPNMMEPFYMKMGTDKPRYSKVCGVMTVGAHRNGGQEIALSQMINSCLLMNNIVISGMTLAGAYIGVAGYSGQMPDFLARDNVLKDDWALLGAKTTGKRVAEMTKIVAEGKAVLNRSGELPQEYKYREGPYKWTLPE